MPQLRAQNKRSAPDYLQATAGLFDVKPHKHDWSRPMRNARNELQWIMALFYWAYKEFISSQDMDSCVFYPSCSTYMILSIQKHGFIPGFLDGMDRLTRCSPFANGKYPFNPKYKKYEDPVE